MTLEYKIGLGLAAIGLSCAIVIGSINIIKSYKELKELSIYRFREEGGLSKKIGAYGKETIKRIEENGREARRKIENESDLGRNL